MVLSGLTFAVGVAASLALLVLSVWWLYAYAAEHVRELRITRAAERSYRRHADDAIALTRMTPHQRYVLDELAAVWDLPAIPDAERVPARRHQT